ncbi:MAG: ATP-grasp domain-containing protein [SAR324 cluster bacterium]|nr:ATP-grasp domain-containing protein [SAR324 cluster bacterium]
MDSGNLSSYFTESRLAGVLSPEEIKKQIRRLRRATVDDYIRRTISPSEHPKRKSAPEVIRQMGGTIVSEVQEGPLYLAEMNFLRGGRQRRVVMLAQNRKNKNGVWMPHHHNRAAALMRFYSAHGMPVVTFIDTPGADAGEEANRNNQAHSISNLITEMASMPLPTVGVVFGNGYSGGAIPLATTNVLLSVRDGVFNTIHPMGLSEIAYNYNLSWQECAKYIGVSAYELCQAGYLDGIVDYSPLESDSCNPLTEAVFSAIEEVEDNAQRILRDTQFHYLFDHYKENILHYLHPTELLIEENRIVDKTPTGRLNVFGVVYRFHRYLKLRRRLSSQSVHRHSRMHTMEPPSGDLQDRMEKDRRTRFSRWVESPLEIRYDEPLTRRYKRYLDTQRALGQERGRITTFFIGNPQDNFNKASQELAIELGLHLYNYWKVEARENLVHLLDYLQERPSADVTPAGEINVLEALNVPAVREHFPDVVKNLVLFDLLYDKLVENLPLIAGELRDTNQITQATMEDLLDKAFKEASSSVQVVPGAGTAPQDHPQFFTWLEHLISRGDVEDLMRQVSEWKRMAFPRLSEPLFGILTYYFTHLLPSYYSALRGEKRFEGKISPRNIGIKDFWNRLNQAYRDLLIQNLLADQKKRVTITPRMVIDELFTQFEEINEALITSDPVHFPGFRQSIDRALASKIQPVGVTTGFANFAHGGFSSRVGVVVSNTQFQAGAFDMASGEKVCKLMVECAANKLPILFFISSGGMQTKEGAGALFSMAVLNSRITRFVKDFDLPILCFGFRDCTGGAQASFVTHRLVKTFYLSGAVIPFAGQRVVPSHLPAEAILANYLSEVEGSMQGLVKNPFHTELDEKLREIDPAIPVPTETIQEAIARTLQGEYNPGAILGGEKQEALPTGYITFAPVRRMLIHARGTTAVRLVNGAHAAGVEAVLVQSDADMESYAARLLGEKDRLVCLGGNTAADSYLNSLSVIRIAEQEEVDAIHPGIGFLSENPNFALLCRRHGFNFVGPRARSMELMGNKSNAIATARKLNISGVPGSQGVVTDPSEALTIAEEIGYPVLIKATFGGGGKGMRVVRDPSQFREEFVRTSQEARGAFGNGDVYLEKFVTSMRHVEVQVLRDRHGNTRILGMRDCSVQRDNQKLIEESGSYKFPKELQVAIRRHGEAIANDIDYIGAGTVEFIFDREAQQVYFMEMNTRLQVEHPVTEMVSGIDIVREQIRIASGESIAGLKVASKGYAMELRINAERMMSIGDGRYGFVASPGKIARLRLPEWPNIRLISAVEEGDEIPPYYDSLIVQIIASGRTRNAVIKTLRDFLNHVQIEGVYTNLALMEAILDDRVFKEGDYDTGFLPEFVRRADMKKVLRRSEARNRASRGVINIKSIQIEDSDELRVLSPRSGVFYVSPTPDDPPFVQVGDVFNVNQPLYLLEAMKVFENLSLADYNNAGPELFPADHQFTITRVLVESGRTVNQGDLLFIVRPIAKKEQVAAAGGGR